MIWILLFVARDINKSYKMNTECNICCNTTIIRPCGANNNCKAMICEDCYGYNQLINIDKDISEFETKCSFCCNIDNARAVNSELKYNIWDAIEGIWSDKYVLFVLQVRSYAIAEEYFECIEFCIPCDED